MRLTRRLWCQNPLQHLQRHSLRRPQEHVSQVIGGLFREIDATHPTVFQQLFAGATQGFEVFQGPALFHIAQVCPEIR